MLLLLAAVNWDPSNVLLAVIAGIAFTDSTAQRFSRWMDRRTKRKQAEADARKLLGDTANVARETAAAVATMKLLMDTQTIELKAHVDSKMAEHKADDDTRFDGIDCELADGKKWMKEVEPFIKKNGNGSH